MGKKRAARLWAAVCALTLITVSWAGAVGLPNPVREATAREIQERMGAPVAVPQGAQDVAYSLIDMTDEEEIAQVQFTLDGIQYCFRTQPGDGLADISGMYYEWTKEDLAPLPGLEAEAHYNEGEAGILLWYHQGRGLACSVSMDTGATLEALVALAQPVAAGQNAEAEPMALTYDLEGETVLTVRLQANPTTGYQWTYEISDPKLLACEKEEYVPDENSQGLMGAGGTYVAVFSPTTQGAGAVELTFRYARQWESGEEPVETYTFQLWIMESGTLSVEGIQ